MTSLRSFAAAMLAGLAWFWHGQAMADYAAGLSAFNSGDFAAAFQQWDAEARNGNAKALHGLAILYETGRGVPSMDAKKAAEFYQAAADQDYAPAITNLARLYEDGRGVTRDLDRAMVLWRRAADLGNPTALYNLAAHYAEGVAVERDDAQAAKYFQAAADLGLPDAQYAMARITREGNGVPVDEIQSLAWLRKAAAAGHPRARMDLAALSHTSPGIEGVESPATVPSTHSSGEIGEAAALANDAETAAAETTPIGSGDAAQSQDTGAVAKPDQAQSDGSTEAASDQPQAPAGEPTSEPASDAEPLANEGGVRYLLTLKGEAPVFRLWLGQSGQEKDAKSQWAKFRQLYPGALGKLELDLRRYYLGEAKGSIYRIFAGPFDDTTKAEAVCRMVIDQDSDQFCRVVVN